MKGPNAATLYRLLPVLAVMGVLTLSYLAQPAALGATSDVGYGYRNNCGIKGDGFHDHGKPCPNRPFPGKGKGLTEAIESGNNASTSSETGATTETDTGIETTQSVASSTTVSTEQGVQSLVGKAHGKGHSHGRGHSNH